LGLSIGVKLDQIAKVLQGVLFADVENGLSDHGAHAALNFVRVDDTTKVGVSHDGTGKGKALFELGLGLVASKERVQTHKGILKPDDKSTQMTSRGEFQQVESVHMKSFNTRQIPQSLKQGALLGIDDKRASPLYASPVPHLTLTSADGSGIFDFLNILIGLKTLQQSHSLFGFDYFSNALVGENKRNLGNAFNAVSSSQNEGRQSRCSQGRADSETLLADVYLPVPSPPNLGGCEHPTTTAHVAEGTLACTVSTTSRYARNTSNGSASTPRFGRGLLSSVARNSIGLSLVLGHGGMDFVNNIRSDGCCENSGQANLRDYLALTIMY